MTLDKAIELMKSTARLMSERYRRTVFDEWAIVATEGRQVLLLGYIGPRKEDFQKDFMADTQELRKLFRGKTYGIGDFEFTRHGQGSQAEAFVVLGKDIYLVCNNTSQTMADIAKDPLWLNAQVPFVEMTDRFRSDPLVPSAA